MQPSEGHSTASCCKLYEQQLQTPILRHPSICNDRQVVALLQQTSKQLQAAVASLLRGQLTVVMHITQLQQVKLLAVWLRRHAALAKSLEVCYMGPVSECKQHIEDAEAANALESAIAAAATAAAPGSLQLQSLTVSVPITQNLLQHLPAAHLTQLDVATSFRVDETAKALARLTRLQELRLANTDLVPEHENTMQQLVAALQQLTQLHTGPVLPEQLQHLPPKLQRLHATVYIHWGSTADIAALWRPELTALCSLDIQTSSHLSGDAVWQEDDVLAPLSVLQQLTRLNLGIVRREQLQHLQLPQLEQLEECCSRTENELLRMGHLTALHKLTLQSYTSNMRREDQLPPNLRELCYSFITQYPDVH
jgi:hypothetical protein